MATNIINRFGNLLGSTRIKLPFGRVSTKQIRRIADISDEYASSNLHATTRQDIQIHFVSLDKTPELWTKLEEDGITIREACGNTVRNVTASPTAPTTIHRGTCTIP